MLIDSPGVSTASCIIKYDPSKCEQRMRKLIPLLNVVCLCILILKTFYCYCDERWEKIPGFRVRLLAFTSNLSSIVFTFLITRRSGYQYTVFLNEKKFGVKSFCMFSLLHLHRQVKTKPELETNFKTGFWKIDLWLHQHNLKVASKKIDSQLFSITNECTQPQQ